MENRLHEERRGKVLLKNYFKTDEAYREQVRDYGKKDAVMALAFWGVVMGIYYFMGQIYAFKGLYMGIPVNIGLASLCMAWVVLRKEKISTIGFTKNKAIKSFALGGVLGALIVIGNSATNIILGRSLASIQTVTIYFVYYLVAISLVEEIIFRGYIQTRIYGLIKKPLFAIILGGILFMLVHIPFRMCCAKMCLLAYVQQNYMTITFTCIWHVVFDFLYRRYNSIYAPSLFHGLLDWANCLFF